MSAQRIAAWRRWERPLPQKTSARRMEVSQYAPRSFASVAWIIAIA